MVFPYGKTASCAVAAASYLAAAHESGVGVSSLSIAEVRELSKALVAKVLTVLSQAGIVKGFPGPGGGYRLAREPGEIRLIDIVRLFERFDENSRCPFGPKWCGTGDPCPVHDQIMAIADEGRRFLEETTLEVFAKSGHPPALK